MIINKTNIDNNQDLINFLHENKEIITHLAKSKGITSIKFCPPIAAEEINSIVFMIHSTDINGKLQFIEEFEASLRKNGLESDIKIYDENASKRMIDFYGKESAISRSHQSAINTAILVNDIKDISFNAQFSNQTKKRHLDSDNNLTNDTKRAESSNNDNNPSQNQQTTAIQRSNPPSPSLENTEQKSDLIRQEQQAELLKFLGLSEEQFERINPAIRNTISHNVIANLEKLKSKAGISLN